jgi:hypothetical protein
VQEVKTRVRERKGGNGMLLVQRKNEFMKEESLSELHHPHDTNHVEGFNKLLTKFLSKDPTYCKQ